MTWSLPSPAEREAQNAARKEANLAVLARTRGRAAVMGGRTTGVVIQKENASQSQPYMRAAKALGYCMRCGCNSSLDFCHADMGKGQGLKTDVRRGWPGCRLCHEIVGRELTKPVRRAVELLLGAMTRTEIEAAGTWPAKLERLEVD
jgi:hypothetical protein